MTEYLFGSGTLIGKRTDVANTPPALIGTLQDVSIDFSRKIESLFGQYSSPVAFGGGEFEIKGKSKFARFQATTLNNLFLGQTQTANSGLEMAIAEAGTIPGSSTYTIQTANHSTYVEDLGVYYASTGVQMTPVNSLTGAGQYTQSGGTYTFDSADAGVAVLIYYSYTVTTEQQIALTNQLMGPVPTFEIFIKQGFTYFGAAKSLVVKLNACVSDKLSLPFTNTKFSIQEFDFMAGADAAGNVGTISMTE